MTTSKKAIFYLTLLTAIWGVTFPVIRNAVVYINPLLFVAIRFTIAALILIPLFWKALKESTWQSLKLCALLGIINSAAFAAQTIGLQTVHSARAAFITGLCVVLVPLAAPLFKLSKPTRVEIICSVICLFGLYILTGANLISLSIGDLWLVLGALLFALAITYLQHISKLIPNHQLLVFYQILFTAPLAWCLSIGSSFSPLLNYHVITAIVICSVGATSLALYLQAKYQPYVSVTKATLIYTLEPIFASFFGFLINSEPLTKYIYIGGSLILLSLILPALLFMIRRTQLMHRID